MSGAIVGTVLGVFNFIKAWAKDRRDWKEDRFTKGPIFKRADIKGWDYSLAHHLCSMNKTISAPLVDRGTILKIDIENHGVKAHEMEITLDGKPADYINCSPSEGVERLRLQYPYNPASSGKPMILRVQYRAGGFRDHQRYDLVHGAWELKRIDPA